MLAHVNILKFNYLVHDCMQIYSDLKAQILASQVSALCPSINYLSSQFLHSIPVNMPNRKPPEIVSQASHISFPFDFSTDLLCLLFWILFSCFKLIPEFLLQPIGQHQRLSLSFDKLMTDVTNSLDSKNRDKFTQNLTTFRHEFRVK